MLEYDILVDQVLRQGETVLQEDFAVLGPVYDEEVLVVESLEVGPLQEAVGVVLHQAGRVVRQTEVLLCGETFHWK